MSYDFPTSGSSEVAGGGGAPGGFNLSLYAPIDPFSSQVVIPGLDLINPPSTAEKSSEEPPTTSQQPSNTEPEASSSSAPLISLAKVKKEPVDTIQHEDTTEPGSSTSDVRSVENSPAENTLLLDIKPDKAKLQREMAAKQKAHSSASVDSGAVDSKMNIQKIHKTTSVDRDPKKAERELRRQREMEVRRHIRDAPAYVPTPIINPKEPKNHPPIPTTPAVVEKSIPLKVVVKEEPKDLEEFRFDNSDSDDEVITIRKKKRVEDGRETPTPTPTNVPEKGVETTSLKSMKMMKMEPVEVEVELPIEEDKNDEPVRDEHEHDVILLSSDDECTPASPPKIQGGGVQPPPEQEWVMTKWGLMSKDAYVALRKEKLRERERKLSELPRRVVKVEPEVVEPEVQPPVVEKIASSESDELAIKKKIVLTKKVIDSDSEESADESVKPAEVKKTNKENIKHVEPPRKIVRPRVPHIKAKVSASSTTASEESDWKRSKNALEPYEGESDEEEIVELIPPKRVRKVHSADEDSKKKKRRKKVESTSTDGGDSMDGFIVYDEDDEAPKKNRKNKNRKKKGRKLESTDETFSMSEEDEERIGMKKPEKKRATTSQPRQKPARKPEEVKRTHHTSEEPKTSKETPAWLKSINDQKEKAAERVRKQEAKKEEIRRRKREMEAMVFPGHWENEKKFRSKRAGSIEAANVEQAGPKEVRKRKTSVSADEPSTSKARCSIDELINSIESSDDEPSTSAPRRIAHTNVQNRPRAAAQPIHKKKVAMEDQLGKSMREAEEKGRKLEAEREKLKNKKYKTQEELYGEKSSRVGSNAKGTAREARPLFGSGGAPKKITIKKEPMEERAQSKQQRMPPCPSVLLPNTMKISLKFRRTMIEQIYKDVYENQKANASERAQEIELELMNSSKTNQTYKVKVMNKLREIRAQSGESVIPVAKNGEFYF